MALCKRDSTDPLLAELVAKGINLIVPPRDGVEPGDLILGSGDAIRVGDWEIATGVGVKAVAKGQPSFTSTKFVVSAKVEAKAGAGLLGKLLGRWNVPEGSISAAMASSGATSLSLDLVAPAVKALENFDQVLQQLRDGGAQPAAPYQENRFFIVERVWRARGLRLELCDAPNTHVTIDAKVREQLSANVGLSFAEEGKGQFSYKADDALIFGLTFREIVFEHGMVRERPSEDPLTFRGGEGQTHQFATEADAFVDFAG